MGGASSLFEETDWEKADGKISGPPDTIDGAPPTETYETYYIIKKGLNQREFDITDSKNNLLYTTRQVPGTICSFDVLGKELGDYKLRVHSDLARRYWIVYRFGFQSFEDQEPDREESDKAQRQLADTDVRLEHPIELYKRICVTVSWSRYLAVSAFFGPPTLEMVIEASKQEAEKKLDKFIESSQGTDPDLETELHKEDRHQQTSNTEIQTGTQPNTTDFTEPQSARESTFHEKTETSHPCNDDENTAITLANDDSYHKEIDASRLDQGLMTDSVEMSNASNHSSRNSRDGDTWEDISPNSMHSASSKSASSMNVQHWFQKHSKNFRDKSRKVLHSTLAASHPLEGVLDLDKPLLLCQEIYTRLIGNHQTTRISKDRVLTLLRQDMAHYLKNNPKEGEADVPMILTTEPFERSDEDSSPGSGVEESKTATEMDDQDKRQPDEEIAKDEPLVAYWNWEHSFQSQKMKMHLAKNSDLALHVVVAIIVNQVRYERNAIAMTV